ncbi:long-chain-alcohol oxidase FAO4A-like [Musa acuminata AAA Group]|uniref:long-chain-alcohol oxidase FAO4A-like n=1 Tax=Musa acuminata AAA Group TaxID=214697 RepID=UPI0031D87E88
MADPEEMKTWKTVSQLTHPNLIPEHLKESLAAVCDTLLPQVDVSSVGDEGLVEFYGTSASMVGTSEHIGGLLSGGLKHPAAGLLYLALWLLSTWYGTFAMCGTRSLSKQFPYFHRFAKVERTKREQILLSWSLGSFPLYAMLFRCLKYLTMRLYFTQLNDDRTNPAWKAMGYCGPDPDLVDQSQHLGTPQHKEKDPVDQEDDVFGPLHSALLHMEKPRDVITRMLHKAGFPAPATFPSSPLTLSCDAAVIGSGSGGSVVAGVLAKAGYKVIVIEKGDYYPSSRLSLLEGPALGAMYEGGGLVATDDVGALLLAGSTVGGGSTVNWSASIRTPGHVRREWCDEHGLELFSSKAYDEALDVVCERMGVQSDVKEEGFNNMILRRGCEKLGYPVANVPCNAPPDHYCGWCHLGCKNGKKQSTKETWLADLADSGNGFILPCCKAVRILYRKGRGLGRSVANGVVVAFGNEEFTVESKVTVVASGALNTPSLLKRSGLKNVHIGKHLHIHPAVVAWGFFPSTRWPEECRKSYEGGILTSMCPLSSYCTLLQTPALHPGMFATVTPWLSAADFRERMTRFSRTAHIFALVRDKGSGTADYPESVVYRMDEEDEEKLKRSLEAAVRILAAAGAEEVGTHHGKGERVKVGGRGGGEGVEELVTEVVRRGLRDGKTPISTAHQMGSCRMAADAKEGAVSPRGETWEVEGLYVADTSVFPTALGVNPMVTVQAIAYCTAQSILQVLQGSNNSSY